MTGIFCNCHPHGFASLDTPYTPTLPHTPTHTKILFVNDLGLHFRSIMTSTNKVDELSEAYEKTVSATLDEHAPLITKTGVHASDSLGTIQRYIKLQGSGESMKRSGGKQDWKFITSFTLNITKL